MNNNKNKHLEEMNNYLKGINLKLNKIEKNIDESTDYNFIEKLILALDVLNIRISRLEYLFKQNIDSLYLDKFIYKDKEIMSEIDKLIVE